MTEAELQREIMQLCKSWGLLCYHTRDSRLSSPGFPDLVIAGRRGVIFAELKSPGGKLSAHQHQWRYTLLANGMAFRIWRPQHWPGEIQFELARLT